MYTKSLNSDLQAWNLYIDGTGEGLPAKVPGSVYQALLDNGKMEDPYYRDNELKALAVMERDYTYVTGFQVSEEFRNLEEVLLRFEGIDTVADIFLNDPPVIYRRLMKNALSTAALTPCGDFPI